MIPLDSGFEKDILPSAYTKCNKVILVYVRKLLFKQSVKYYIKEFKKIKKNYQIIKLNIEKL
jgi:hypothetical protein